MRILIRDVRICFLFSVFFLAACAGKGTSEAEPESQTVLAEAALMKHKVDFRNCYERELKGSGKSISGIVRTKFVIDANGKVINPTVESTTLKNQHVEDCVLHVIQKVDFPKPKDGGKIEIVYPFKFTPSK